MKFKSNDGGKAKAPSPCGEKRMLPAFSCRSLQSIHKRILATDHVAARAGTVRSVEVSRQRCWMDIRTERKTNYNVDITVVGSEAAASAIKSAFIPKAPSVLASSSSRKLDSCKCCRPTDSDLGKVSSWRS